MAWFYIVTESNRRPDHPEDNEFYVEAKHMDEALERLRKLSGHIPTGKSLDVKACRKVHSMVFTDARYKELTDG